jgi:chloramphenicol 3-O phosphotransferase
MTGMDGETVQPGPASATTRNGPVVLMLNGGSSSGKSSLARALQARLPDQWLTLGVDTLLQAMPVRLMSQPGGVVFTADGGVTVGEEFRTLEAAWIRGLAEMVRAGAKIIVDEAFLEGRSSQDRWRPALEGLDVVWIAVHCDAGEAERREARRAGRVTGMARAQALSVHAGVDYDIEVDTTRITPEVAADQVSADLLRRSQLNG